MIEKPHKAMEKLQQEEFEKEMRSRGYILEGLDPSLWDANGYFAPSEKYEHVVSNNEEHGVFNSVKGQLEVVSNDDKRATHLELQDQQISTDDAYNAIPTETNEADFVTYDISQAELDKETAKLYETYIPIDVEEQVRFASTALEEAKASREAAGAGSGMDDMLTGHIVPLALDDDGNPDLESLVSLLDDVGYSPDIHTDIDSVRDLLNKHPNSGNFIFSWDMGNNKLDAITKVANLHGQSPAQVQAIVNVVRSGHPQWTTASKAASGALAPLASVASTVQQNPAMQRIRQMITDGDITTLLSRSKAMMRGHMEDDRQREINGMSGLTRADLLEVDYDNGIGATVGLERLAIKEAGLTETDIKAITNAAAIQKGDTLTDEETWTAIIQDPRVAPILETFADTIFGSEGLGWQHIAEERTRIMTDGFAEIQAYRTWSADYAGQRAGYIQRAAKDLLGWEISTAKELLDKAFEDAADESVNNMSSATTLATVNAILEGATTFISKSTGGSNASYARKNRYLARLQSAGTQGSVTPGTSTETTNGILFDYNSSLYAKALAGDPDALATYDAALRESKIVYAKWLEEFGVEGEPVISFEQFIGMDESGVPAGLTEYYTLIPHALVDANGQPTGEFLQTRMTYSPGVTMALISTIYENENKMPGLTTNVAVRNMGELVKVAFAGTTASQEQLNQLVDATGQTQESFVKQELGNLSTASSVILMIEKGKSEFKTEFKKSLELNEKEWGWLVHWANDFLKTPEVLNNGTKLYKTPNAIWHDVASGKLNARKLYNEVGNINDSLRNLIRDMMAGTLPERDVESTRNFFSPSRFMAGGVPTSEGTVMEHPLIEYDAHRNLKKFKYKTDSGRGYYDDMRPQILNLNGGVINSAVSHMRDFGMPIGAGGYSNKNLLTEWGNVQGVIERFGLLPKDTLDWINGTDNERFRYDASKQKWVGGADTLYRTEAIYDNIRSPHVREIGHTGLRRAEIGLALVMNRLAADPRFSSMTEMAWHAIRSSKDKTVTDITTGARNVHLSQISAFVNSMYNVNAEVEQDDREKRLQNSNQSPVEKPGSPVPVTTRRNIEEDSKIDYHNSFAMGGMPSMLAASLLGTVEEPKAFHPQARGVYVDHGNTQNLWIDYAISSTGIVQERTLLPDGRVNAAGDINYGASIKRGFTTTIGSPLVNNAEGRADFLMGAYPELLMLSQMGGLGEGFDPRTGIPPEGKHVTNEVSFEQVGAYPTLFSLTDSEAIRRRTSMISNNVFLQPHSGHQNALFNTKMLQSLGGLGMQEWNQMAAILIDDINTRSANQAQKKIRRAPEGDDRDNQPFWNWAFGGGLDPSSWFVEVPEGEYYFYNHGEVKSYEDVRKHFPSDVEKQFYIYHEILRSLHDPSRVNPLIADIIKSAPNKPRLEASVLGLLNGLEKTATNVTWQEIQYLGQKNTQPTPITMMDETAFDTSTAQFLLETEGSKELVYYVGDEEVPTIGIGTQRSPEVDKQLRGFGYNVEALWRGEVKLDEDHAMAVSKNYSGQVKDQVKKDIGMAAWNHLSYNQQIALIDLGYNLGKNFLTPNVGAWEKMRKALIAKDPDKALLELQFVNSNDRSQGESKYWRGESGANTTRGSINRREAVAKLWKTPSDVAEGMIKYPDELPVVKTRMHTNGWITRYGTGMNPLSYVWNDNQHRANVLTGETLNGTGQFKVRFPAFKGAAGIGQTMDFPWSFEKDYMYYDGYIGGEEFIKWHGDYAKNRSQLRGQVQDTQIQRMSKTH